MTDLTELAKRVEAATGPDRELDAAICLALGIVRERDGDCFYGHRDYSVMVLERDYYDNGNVVELPAPTASLDCAMTLVPEGYDWAVFRTNGGLTIHAWCGSRDDVFAATPSLALTAAALRARAAMGDG